MLEVTFGQVAKLRFFGLLNNRQLIVKTVPQILFRAFNPGDNSVTVRATSWSFVVQAAPCHCHLIGPLTVRLAVRRVTDDSEVQHEALSLPPNSRGTFKHMVFRSMESADTSLLIFWRIIYYLLPIIFLLILVEDILLCFWSTMMK